MRSTYIERIQKLSEKLSDPALAERARKINSNTFSRNRKMPLKDILLCCLSKKRAYYYTRIEKLFYTKGCSFHENVETRVFTTAKAS